MNLAYSSVIILKENTLGGGKSRVRSSETQLHYSKKACNAGSSQHQQDVSKRTERQSLETEGQRQRECLCVCACVCVLVFGGDLGLRLI